MTLFNPTSSTCAQRPPVVSGRLRRVLYVIGLNPSLKFGSLEEQIFCLARAFKEEGGLFLPLFQSPLGPEARAMYHAAGLEVEWLNLDTFNVATLRRLMRLIREHRIELLHWNFYRPVNLYVYSLKLLMPRLRNYLTDHNTLGNYRSGPVLGPLRKVLKKALGLGSALQQSLLHQRFCPAFVSKPRACGATSTPVRISSTPNVSGPTTMRDREFGGSSTSTLSSDWRSGRRATRRAEGDRRRPRPQGAGDVAGACHCLDCRGWNRMRSTSGSAVSRWT